MGVARPRHICHREGHRFQSPIVFHKCYANLNFSDGGSSSIVQLGIEINAATGTTTTGGYWNDLYLAQLDRRFRGLVASRENGDNGDDHSYQHKQHQERPWNLVLARRARRVGTGDHGNSSISQLTLALCFWLGQKLQPISKTTNFDVLSSLEVFPVGRPQNSPEGGSYLLG